MVSAYNLLWIIWASRSKINFGNGLAEIVDIFHSKRDVLPGLEVRLLPHQIIGVSW